MRLTFTLYGATRIVAWGTRRGSQAAGWRKPIWSRTTTKLNANVSPVSIYEMAHLPRRKAANPKKLPPAPERKQVVPAMLFVAVSVPYPPLASWQHEASSTVILPFTPYLNADGRRQRAHLHPTVPP